VIVMEKPRHWWHGDVHVVPCRLCGCPIQARAGRIGEGMRAHFATVHPEVSEGGDAS
jgi:hypothetical protein